MDIKDLKKQLSINQVLQHYNLKPDKNDRLNCPFHPDKNPSLQIYPKTNTYCCFSSNCKAGTGDQIQFIELKENCTKHEALLKATALLNGNAITTVPPPAAKLFIEAEPLEKIAVLTKLFKYFTKSLPLTKKAVDYTESRAINYKLNEVGFNTGDWHHKLNEKNFIASCEQCGLLKARPAGGFNVWAKDCIIFPLKNIEHKIVSLYGRSITNNEESRHFYLSNRSGLYPGYPKAETKKLIVVESIIDAASLLQQKEIIESFTILALYGTNGLTEEHGKAIIELPQLEEIILMLNADDAGAAATHKHAHVLQALLPHLHITCVQLPAGEDVNSLLQSHDDPKILSDIIEQRTNFSFSIEKEKLEIIAGSSQQSKLNTSNNELLIYDNCELYFEILGGIKITGLDRMKVTLKIKHKEKVTMPQWYSLDLYNQAQREQTINNVAETLELSSQQTTNTFINLITELEQHRIKKIEALQPKEKPQQELTATQRTAAINELKKPNLLQRTAEMIALTGIVGEANNSMIAYLVYCTRKQPVPLHIMFLGSSGSGKTYLQEKISELVPAEDKIEITQITENALYYFKQEELKNKLILIEDLDGAMTVFYPLRELQTKRKITKTVTLKDSKGNLKTITLTVEGPVCVSGCTTKEKIYEDNANRCILLYTDQSRDQDKKVNEYQTKLSGGEINREREKQYKELFKNIQSVLRPINIINPFAKYIELPEQVFKPRRTMTLLLGFIEAVTFYHQYQREVKKDSNNQLFIETTIEDIEAAFNLLKDVLFSKSDELTQVTRGFLEKLKQHLSENKIESFTAQQIRKVFRVEPRTIQRYIRELKQYGFIKPVSGFVHRKGFEYTIADANEYSQLKTEIDTHLQSILEHLRKL
ncbi:MAG: toprim domain-containing protein [Aquabacterium sp.]|nr:toprim domain-containing protein [Ferruginibacter sp.]